MGAKHSCCAYSSPRLDRGKKGKGKRGRETTESDPYEQRQNNTELGGKVSESCGNLQHISEREPDDWEEDPSLHPTQVWMLQYVYILYKHLSGHHVHGEVQTVFDKWDGSEEITDAVGWFNFYGRLHDAEKGL